MNTSSQQQVHSTSEHSGWTFDMPPSHLRGAKMQLLTIGGVCVLGTWYGGLGQYFVGYAPMLKVNNVFNGPRR